MFGQAGQRKISVSCRIGCVASPKDYIYFVLDERNGLLSYDARWVEVATCSFVMDEKHSMRNSKSL